MKRNYFIKHILLACSVLVLFSACRKVPEGDMSNEDPNAGTSYIGIPSGMEKATFFDPFTNKKTITVFTIKKDAANHTDLEKANTIVLKALPDAITAYNEANETDYVQLPSSYYENAGSDASIGGDGSLTFNFAPGDFQKYFTIKLDGSKLDLSKKYALAYQIVSTDGLAIHAASKDTLYAFYGVKNAYDGNYHSSGAFHHPTAGDRDLDDDKDLVTSGATSVTTYAADVGGTLTLTVNPDNTVTVSGGLSASQPFLTEAGSVNKYDPATKTFTLNYYYVGSGGNRVIEETLTKN